LINKRADFLIESALLLCGAPKVMKRDTGRWSFYWIDCPCDIIQNANWSCYMDCVLKRL